MRGHEVVPDRIGTGVGGSIPVDGDRIPTRSGHHIGGDSGRVDGIVRRRLERGTPLHQSGLGSIGREVGPGCRVHDLTDGTVAQGAPPASSAPAIGLVSLDRARVSGRTRRQPTNTRVATDNGAVGHFDRSGLGIERRGDGAPQNGREVAETTELLITPAKDDTALDGAGEVISRHHLRDGGVREAITGQHLPGAGRGDG